MQEKKPEKKKAETPGFLARNGKTIGIVAAAVALLTLLALGSAQIFSGGDKGNSERDNILVLAADYLDQNEYERALDLVESLLLQNPGDEDARAIRDRAIEQKQVAEAVERAANTGNSAQSEPLASQQAETAARAREAAARVAEAEARRQEAELELQRQLSQQRRQEELRRQQDEEARLQAEEARIAALSAEEAARQRRINELLSEAKRLQEQQQFVNSRGKIKQALELDEDSALAYARMAETYVEEDISNNDNLSNAIQLAEQSIARDEELWEPYYTLGRIFNQTKQYDKAIRKLFSAAELNSTNSDIFYALGNAQFDARRYSDARQSYEACVFLDSSNQRAFFNLGLILERMNQDNLAIENYKKAVAVKSDYASAYNRIGELLIESGDLDGALSNLMQAVRYDDNARNNRALARTYYKLKNYGEALNYYNTTLELEPEKAINHYNVATVLLDMNRPGDARVYAGEAVRLDSSDGIARYEPSGGCAGIRRRSGSPGFLGPSTQLHSGAGDPAIGRVRSGEGII